MSQKYLNGLIFFSVSFAWVAYLNLPLIKWPVYFFIASSMALASLSCGIKIKEKYVVLFLLFVSYVAALNLLNGHYSDFLLGISNTIQIAFWVLFLFFGRADTSGLSPGFIQLTVFFSIGLLCLSGGLLNPNMISAFIFINFFLLCFALQRANLDFIFLILFLTILFFGSRSVAFAALLFFVAIRISWYRNFILMNSRLTLFALFSLVVGIIFIVVSINEIFPGAVFLGKGLDSGRSTMWAVIIDAISARPVFGYGIGLVWDQLYDTRHSPHNLYLALLLQGGFVHLFIFLTVFYSIFLWLMRRAKTRQCSDAYIAGAGMLAILFVSTFEIPLFQVNSLIGLAFVYSVMCVRSRTLA